MNNNIITTKCVIVGNAGVGKTALCHRLAGEEFRLMPNTIGVDYHKIKTASRMLAIWDTAGAERFRNIVSTYFDQGTVVLVAFSLETISTLYSVPQWMKDVRQVNRDCTFVVVGCKSDRRVVEETQIRQVLASRGIDAPYVECSAKIDTPGELRARLVGVFPPMEAFQIEEPGRRASGKKRSASRPREHYYCPGCRVS